MKYTFKDDNGSQETLELDSIEEAEEYAENWVLSGSWGEQGCIVDVDIYDEDGDHLTCVSVEIEPDHESLIREATGGEGCGVSPDDHKWTREGCGGCNENPGVWSLGGTRMSYLSRCTECGLRREIIDPGNQRNPDETIKYSYWI